MVSHDPVLLDRVVALLAPALDHDGAVLVDATLGLGGHTEAVLSRCALARVIGIDRDPDALALAGGSLLDRGVSVLWERAGAAGSLLRTHQESVELTSLPATVADVTGAGDAMLAAYCHAVLGGSTPAEAARYGHAAAALTVGSRHTVRPDLTDATVRSLL